jgi:hypothetical protein
MVQLRGFPNLDRKSLKIEEVIGTLETRTFGAL